MLYHETMANDCAWCGEDQTLMKVDCKTGGQARSSF